MCLRRFFLTLIFMPDPLRVSLTEVDRRWSYIRAGKPYHVRPSPSPAAPLEAAAPEYPSSQQCFQTDAKPLVMVHT